MISVFDSCSACCRNVVNGKCFGCHCQCNNIVLSWRRWISRIGLCSDTICFANTTISIRIWYGVPFLLFLACMSDIFSALSFDVGGDDSHDRNLLLITRRTVTPSPPPAPKIPGQFVAITPSLHCLLTMFPIFRQIASFWQLHYFHLVYMFGTMYHLWFMNATKGPILTT